MKTFLMLVSIGLATAIPLESEFNLYEEVSLELEPNQEILLPNETYPQVITEFEDIDLSKISIQQLIKHHPSPEFYNTELAASLYKHSDLTADAFSTTCQMVKRRGYSTETHRIKTSDGYILEIHRISGSPKRPPKQKKRVAYLQHGLFDSSVTWVIMGVKRSLGYILADLGYDVWLGNVRGNRYSRKHETHDPDGGRGNRRKFWNFSWHQMGTIDLPAIIDYITQVTGNRRMHYVGHSQGTTSYFVMLSERPEYNKRIISAHMLAPIAFMGNLRSPFVRASAFFLKTLDMSMNILGIYEFLPNNQIMAELGQAACRDEAWFQSVCSNILFLVGGYNSAQLNTTMLPIIMGHTPAGASVDQVVHYGQGIRSNEFRQFDHGYVSNLLAYGSLSPPAYNLANIKAPTTLYYSLNDLLSEPVDVKKLHRGMSNQQPMVLISDKLFNHFDYVWAIDAKTLVYDKVVKIMKDNE